MEYFVAFCMFLTAVFTFAMSYFQWCDLVRHIPEVTAFTTDLYYATHRGHEHEALQKQGFCKLVVSVKASNCDYRFKSVKIPHCQIPCKILNQDGSWSDQPSDRMTHKSVPFDKTVYGNRTELRFEMLIKPDAKEEADLELIIKGSFFTRIRVPFHYKKTHYFGE